MYWTQNETLDNLYSLLLLDAAQVLEVNGEDAPRQQHKAIDKITTDNNAHAYKTTINVNHIYYIHIQHHSLLKFKLIIVR